MSDFDTCAREYREIHNTNLKNTGYTSAYLAERKVLEILRHRKEKGSLNILDLGCGDGLVAVYFRKYFPCSFISGLDVSEELIKVSKNWNIENCEFKIYDGKRVPYSENSFDIILLANILHHITSENIRLCLLKECRRVLKTSGNLFIFEHNPYNPITIKIVKNCQFDQDARLINYLDLKKLLTKTGFKSSFKFIIFLPGFIKRKEYFEKFFWWLPIGGQYYSIAQKVNYHI